MSEKTTTASAGGDAAEQFAAFMKAANAPGVVDARTKKLIAVALSTATRCHPCLVFHLKAAAGMGITRAELDEAAGLAFAFGGCPTLMFYKEVCAEIGLK